jgi:hypothetical protein
MKTAHTISRRILTAACLSTLCCILAAGLWPLHAPKNAVSWLSDRDGLLFGDYGSILSSSEFKTTGLEEGPCSLEIWLEPAATFDSNDIVAFSTPQNPMQFAVAQSSDDLFVLRAFPGAQHHLRKTAHIGVGHAFRKGNKLLITVTSGGPKGTAVYLNGALVKTSHQFTFSGKDFGGVLVIANSPVQNNTWGGQLWGLGIFDRELTPAQVLQDYGAWTKNRGVELVGREGTRALYLFNEHAGRVVRNQVASEPDLFIPENYFVLHQKFLEPFWAEFEPNWTFGRNVILNIVAFIPLGFFFCAYLSLGGRLNRAVLPTIILGGAVSLTIEVLQAFLPTRDSGTADLITNTLGTAVGAMLYSCFDVQDLFARFGLQVNNSNTSDLDRKGEEQPSGAKVAVTQEAK